MDFPSSKCLLVCTCNGNGVDGKGALLIVANGMFTPEYEHVVINKANIHVGSPPAPTVTSITLTQSSTNSSSLLISWSMSDCAVHHYHQLL